MENPISYSDLFSPDIQQGIEGLVSDIMRVEKQLKGMLEGVKSEAQALGEALAGVSSASKGGRDTTKADSAQVDRLYDAYNQLSKMYEENQKTLKALLEVEKTQNERLAKAKTATDEYASALERLKAQADLAKDALAKVGSSGNSAEVKQLEAVVKSLEEQVKNLTKVQNANAAATNNAGRAHSKNKTELLSLADAYSTLSPLVEATGVDLSELIVSQRQQQQVSKNGEIANNSLAGSYNQLYAQYNLIKTALNAMSIKMRESTEVGKVWEAEALRIMNVMKTMQEATGKNTLSIGDYGKALNGLSISTQQVLREVPTLANSLQQFFIAISNNVPIFVDNFKRAQAELGGFMAAIGATLRVIFSWQSVLLVLLTILPRIAKAISDKRKEAEKEAEAQKKANKENKEAAFVLKDLHKTLLDIEKSAVSAVSEVNFLTNAMGDNTRSWQERIDAGKRLKEVLGEELAGFSAEEVALGRAAANINAYTNAIYEQAKAQQTLKEITELTGQLIELQSRKALWDESTMFDPKGVKTTKEIYAEYVAMIDKAYKEGRQILYIGSTWENDLADYRKIISDIEAVQNRINTLSAGIKPINLIAGGADAAKEEIMEIPDYLKAAAEAYLEGMEDGLDKSLALMEFAYAEQLAEREKAMAELKASLVSATKEERAIIIEQMTWLSGAMIQDEENYIKARQKVWDDYLDTTYRTETPEDMDFEGEAIKDLEVRLKVQKKMRDAAAYEDYERGLAALKAGEENAKSEVELKAELNKALLDSEKTYWENYLKQLREEGLLTIDAYNTIMAELSKAEGKPKTQKKRGRASFSSFTEFALSLTSLPKEAEAKGFSQEYQNFITAINAGLETSINYMNEWMDTRIEMAEVAVAAAEKEAGAAKEQLDYELEARANGYANNVGLAQKEYEEKKKLQEEAIAEQQRLERIQEAINTAQQISSLITATANIWSAYAGIPFAGPGLAAAVTALMWSSFLASKIAAAQYAKQSATTYGEGMGEYLNYGNSHASGHDIDFGADRNGRRRRVERGEVIGVINKKNVDKYGPDIVLGIIDSLNKGTFEENYVSPDALISSVIGETEHKKAHEWAILSRLAALSGVSGVSDRLYSKTLANGLKNATIEARYEAAFPSLPPLIGGTDVSSIERDVAAIRRTAESSRYVDADGNTVIRYKNLTRTIRS